MKKKGLITVPVLGGTYQYDVKSPDEEEIIRKVAKEISTDAEKLMRGHPGRSETEIARMIALNAGIRAAKAERELESLRKAAEGLHDELESYLEKD